MEIILLKDYQNVVLSKCEICWFRDDANKRIIPKLMGMPTELKLTSLKEQGIIDRMPAELLDEFESKIYTGVMEFIEKYPPKYNLKGAEDYPIITDYTKIRV